MAGETPKKNNRLVLAERPERGPVTPTTFRHEEVDIKPLADGEVMVKVEYSAIVSTFASCRCGRPDWRRSLQVAARFIDPLELLSPFSHRDAAHDRKRL